MVSHGNVVNFVRGLNEGVWSEGGAVLVVGLTSITFDISVLELMWPLTRGGQVLLMEEGAVSASSSLPPPLKTGPGMQFSLFYFATEDAGDGRDQYRLLIEGATYADRHGFTAVWTPERHFHAFGGLYPNPSVVGAALATVTKQIQIRGGSVVLPLHHPIRVAEEWALVDNLSQGRVGIAFASGWHADDFVFFPENYPDRRELMFRNIEVVQRLWRGESIRVLGGSGTEIDVRVFPKPIQTELPVWITAAGNAETFEKAGKIGAKVLTHLLGQSVTEVAEHLKLYREALARHGHDPQVGHVTLMLHTFIGESRDAVKKKVAAPFINYLRSSFGLVTNLIRSLDLPFQPERMSAQDQDDLLAFAFERYFETGALFGTPATCMPMIERLKEIGVDEIACLIDFGLDTDEVLAGLSPLKELKERSNKRLPDRKEYSLSAQTLRHHPSILQSTPSLLKMLLLNPASLHCLAALDTLLVGGEPFPPALFSQLRQHFSGRIFNMYGPTETTIWSSAELLSDESQISIGRPLANTQLYILDQQQEPVPIGVCGELYIGGRGVARGYLGGAGLSAERFVPDHLSGAEGGRLYRTGDVVRYLRDGRIEYVGRGDRQVKVRGHRVELGEVEAVLGGHAGVEQSAVVMREVEGWEEEQLVGYVVMKKEGVPGRVEELRGYMQERVGGQMVPTVIMEIEEMPLTANGKVDHKALPRPRNFRSDSKAGYTEPRSKMEHLIAAIWREALGLEKVGVHDNFFDLGGHSLLMAQVHNQLKEVLSEDLPLIKILEHPTISSLAQYLGREKGEDFSLQSSQTRALKQRESLLRQKQSSLKTRPKHP
jgi:natural product biosynthesis luciferase-like monooxygenase protein